MSALLPDPLLAEPRLIREGDCLYALLQDLRRAGCALVPWDADAREAWLVACVDLLRCVPDLIQRYCWAILLAEGLVRVGLPVPLAVGELLRRVEGWK